MGSAWGHKQERGEAVCVTSSLRRKNPSGGQCVFTLYLSDRSWQTDESEFFLVLLFISSVYFALMTASRMAASFLRVIIWRARLLLFSVWEVWGHQHRGLMGMIAELRKWASVLRSLHLGFLDPNI